MTNTQTFSVRLDIEFSDDDIDLHIFGSGVFSYPWWKRVSVMPTLGRVGIIAGDPDDEDDTTTNVIAYDDIRRVMGNIVAAAYPNEDYYALVRQQILDGIMRNGDFDIDADGADEIMQIAMFGEVVYS